MASDPEFISIPEDYYDDNRRQKGVRSERHRQKEGWQYRDRDTTPQKGPRDEHQRTSCQSNPQDDVPEGSQISLQRRPEGDTATTLSAIRKHGLNDETLCRIEDCGSEDQTDSQRGGQRQQGIN
ncbi:hypothetical protein PSA01_43630 [Pseudonocardia saturnea]|uniref:Uncharacterized protein n=1 Tax=Pseudonocardia saturnea TaxID=33909 RepID=A0ABQ0S343_9PSEU|nr:hypothetical protein PSA01_43630 [Pseudonocardia saturnea]